jgi:L-lactate dehydrogenase complex protein LldG
MDPKLVAQMRETIRTALASARLPGASATRSETAQEALTAAPSIADLTARFRRELEAVGGSVHEAATVEEVSGLVLNLINSQASRRMLAWDDLHLPVPGLLTRLAEAGVEIVSQPAARDSHDRERRLQDLASIAIGLTGADAGLAESGSLVLASGPGRGRLASLLTPVHVALLRRSDIWESLPHLLRERPELVTRGSNLVCITGPSRTADIEHTLSRGVHGPGEVHVILLEA